MTSPTDPRPAEHWTTPPTAVAGRALDVARASCSPALLNHSVRSYAFALALAEADGLAVDRELLYVAALLHDLGVVPEFDSHTVPFERAGGRVAWVFAAGAGWPVERRDRLADVIERHMWPAVDVELDVEGHLLERSTSIDVRGAGVDDVPLEVRRAVVEAWPRLDFATEFPLCLADQARRKPASQAARSVQGLDEAAHANPLDRL